MLYEVITISVEVSEGGISVSVGGTDTSVLVKVYASVLVNVIVPVAVGGRFVLVGVSDERGV